jgi:protein-tyrosine phosphatase
MPSVLFVCTANICRSPLALGLFKQKISKEPDASFWKVDSAGTWALEGEPASSKSQFLLEQKGIDIHDHRSKSVSLELLRSHRLILTMESGQKEALQSEFPKLKNRIFLLSEMIGQRYDIQDPYTGALDDYRSAMEEIERILNQGFEKICSLAQDQASGSIS